MWLAGPVTDALQHKRNILTPHKYALFIEQIRAGPDIRRAPPRETKKHMDCVVGSVPLHGRTRPLLVSGAAV
jgi:hypothetical protein